MTTTKSIYDLHSLDEAIRALEAELAETVRMLQDEQELDRVRKRAWPSSKGSNGKRTPWLPTYSPGLLQ